MDYINYFICVMVVIIFDKFGFEVCYIMFVSGYRSESLIWSYSKMDELIKKRMLEMLIVVVVSDVLVVSLRN